MRWSLWIWAAWWPVRSPERTGQMKETVQILYHSDAIRKLEYIEGKSDWVDLRSAERVELKKGEFYLINLGVSIRIPRGYEAHMVPRSSSFKNWGFLQTNSMGVIDNSYCSSSDVWKLPVYATRDAVIEVNDRICQFRIMKNQPELVFEEVDSLDGPARGGFGSTGKG